MSAQAKQVWVAREKFEHVIAANGLSFEALAGWLKVEPVPGRRLYVAITKTVRRITLADVELSLASGDVILPKQGAYGRVKQEVNMIASDETEMLLRFERVLKQVMAMDPVTAQPKAKPGTIKPVSLDAQAAAPSSSPAPVDPLSAPVHRLDADGMKRRLELLALVAKEKGVSISPHALLPRASAPTQPEAQADEA